MELEQETSRTNAYRRRLKDLEQDFSTWKEHLVEIQENVMPRKGRYLSTDNEDDNDGTKKHQHIMNSTPTTSVQVLSAGIMSYLTNPALPWFRLVLSDPALNDVGPVKVWLDEVQTIMRDIFSQCNLYSSLSSIYTELALFGTGVMLIEPSFDTVIRTRVLTAGEYFLGVNGEFIPDTLYRRFSMTGEQLGRTFGTQNLSEAATSAWESKNLQQRFKVIHVIQPRLNRRYGKDDPRNMAWESVYFEEQGDHEKVLRESGYRTQPFAVARWTLDGSDTYGKSPAMDALGDIKQLHKMEEKKLRAIDLLTEPPMVGPSSLRNEGGTIIPGDVTYLDVTQGGQGFSPAFQVRPDTTAITAEGERVERRIRETFYNDIFVSIMQMTKQMTATEVKHLQLDKMLRMGPVVERIEQGLLNPIIIRAFHIIHQNGLLPPPPTEIQGQQWNIQYMGILSQAQRAVDTTGIAQLVAFAQNVAAGEPGVLDNINFDEAVTEYAEKLGTPTKLIRSPQEVEEIRKQRAQQIAAQQRQAAAAQVIDSAKTLSEAKTDENTMLGQLLQVR